MASTFIGGSSNDDDEVLALYINSNGNVYVAGETASGDFPTTTGAYDITYNGGGEDAFASKFDNNLQNLLASTFLGGSLGDDVAESIFLDSNNYVYITGGTNSSDFPVTFNSYDKDYNGGGKDSFIAKLDSDLQNLHASTFLGGELEDIGRSLSLDCTGNVYITGWTFSSNFPVTSNSYDTIHSGSWDRFIAKLDKELENLLAATLGVGGISLSIGNDGNIYVAGFAVSSSRHVTQNSYDPDYNGGRDSFVAKIDPDLSSKGPWTQKKEGPTNRAGLACVAYNDRMYIFGGGCDYREENFDDLWEYNFIEDSWSSKGNAPVKRAPSGVVYNGKMYIFGGAGDDIAHTEAAKELWAYDFTNETWGKKTSGPYGLSLHTAVVYNGKMYVFGGEIANSGQMSDELWAYDFTNDTWSLISTALRTFHMHSSVVYNDKMYVFGGLLPGPYLCDSNDIDYNSYQLWEYDFNTTNWEHICDAPISRSGHTAVVHNGEMYIFGGGTFYLDQFCEGCLVESNALWKYNFSKNSWSQIENIGSWPDSRAGHSALVYNHKMYIFGGGIFGDLSDPYCFNDLWEYDFEFYVRFADYFPTDSRKYGIKSFEWIFGKTGQFTRRIEGNETVPYKSIEITGTRITNYFDSNSGLIFNDGENVKFLGTEDYYLFSDCNLTDHPAEFSFDTFYDGMTIDQNEYYYINKDNFTDCGMDGNQMLLINIQDVTVLDGDYENAVIIWWLDKDYPFTDLNFHDKELDMGISFPTSSDTKGYSITAFDIFGFETGPVAGGDVSTSTGDLVDLSELTDDIVREVNLPAGWSMVSLPVNPNSATISSLFPGAVVVYGYEREQGYGRVEKLEVGDGYWILLDQNQTFNLIGQPVESYKSKVNKPTAKDYIWDMVGGCSYMARPTIVGCTIGIIYKYVQGLGYVRVKESGFLKPGEGHWIQFKDIADQAELTVEAISLNGV